MYFNPRYMGCSDPNILPFCPVQKSFTCLLQEVEIVPPFCLVFPFISVVVVTITPLLGCLEISASITSVSNREKLKGGTSWQTGTSANSIVKPNFTIFKANRSCVIFAHISKQPMSCKMILEYSGFGNNATYFPVEIATSLQRLCNISNPHFSDVAK